MEVVSRKANRTQQRSKRKIIFLGK